jgi:hypothetical protein
MHTSEQDFVTSVNLWRVQKNTFESVYLVWQASSDSVEFNLPLFPARYEVKL